ncbi:TetR family transcriptional regulator [Dermatobacter hominis]|uniref:TetR family transcriptional regulator n=1 Tax=Dermatobacter hominis TaxID=2884263 RepID=UPI001D1276E7|nr:TetR family transcriptional regulator [Dermatobacter hominis]UDY35425.1 TetR family transcriptional regulator [Dermatobacter hominis]
MSPTADDGAGPRPDTAKGRSARAAIVEAVWAALDEADLAQLTGGMSVRQVAAAAGVSAGGVQYHFPTMRDLGAAMVDSLLLDVAVEPIDAAAEGAALLASDGLAAAVRAAAQFNWDALESPDELAYDRRLQRVLALAHGTGPDAVELRRRLRDEFWGSFRPVFEAMLQAMLDTTDRRLVEPFTVTDLARVTGALAEGLRVQQTCHDGAIRADLYADAVVAMATALTVPVSRPRSVSEVAVELHQVRSSASEGVVGLAAVARAAAPLFADGFEDVGFASIVAASELDVALEDVVEAFGDPRVVAAVSFSRHLDALGDAASRRRAASPDVALADLVLELARRAQAEPWVAVALVQERAAAATRSARVDDGADVRSLVPLDPLVAGLLADARPELGEREAAAVAVLVVDTTLAQAAARTTEAVSALSRRVLRLVPPPAS